MAQNAPPSQDVQEIQFKLHDKFTIFPEGKELKSLVSLLAVSSTKGLLFAGNQNATELKVFKLRDIVDSKTTGQDLKVRVITLPGEPKALSCSCDGSMLAINYVLNNTGFLQIIQVDSFVTPNLNVLYNLPIAPESNVFVLQLLWNTVIANNIALILTDGSVTMLTLNPGGQYDKVTLAKENQVKSGCWSPKGKQIVFGFANGKLQQFKPNLQPARAIPCPPGLLLGPFDCIAVHWLSTFQFAAIFLQRGQDMCPSLFIVNAPKSGQPSYINYFDICYSAPGPRIHQLSFNHIAQWNLLLVTSANGVEVGILGTRESGETPNWVQYTLLDEARIEMPLTNSKDETYPLGFAYDTASSHQVAIGENKLPVMPMVHVLSTHGHLVSFNFLNLSPNAIGVCSPPPPLNDVSGQFISTKETLGGGPKGQATEPPARKGSNANVNVSSGGMAPPAGQSFGDATFSVSPNMVTSTPAIKDKPVPLFGAQATAAKPGAAFGFPSATTVSSASAIATTTKPPSTSFGFGGNPTTSAPTATPFSQTYGNITTGTTFGASAATGFGETKPKEPSVQKQANQTPATSTQTTNVNKNAELNKPLYTVPATFTPPPVQQTLKPEAARPSKSSSSTKLNLNTGEIDEVVKQMIVIQMEAFEAELKQIQNQSKQLMENIGSPNEIKSYTKQLNDLQEIIEQADDHEFEQDVQSLRHSMNESYAMLAECRTKLDLYNNPNLNRLSTVSHADPINRRQLSKLQAYCASNQTQLSQLNQLIDAQWSQYQDVVRRNSKNQMHIPCLDGVYQRMSKLKDMLSRQRTKMNYIQTKLKQKGLNYKPSNDVDITSVAVGALTKNQSTMESLADSILSMSLSQVVNQTHAKLSEDKLNAIRDFTRRQQRITIIKPKRPDRVGLKSEVILETKLQTERKQKEQQQQHQQQQHQQQQHQQQYQVSSFKGPQQAMPNKTQQQDAFRSQMQQQQQQIHKPQATMQISQQQQPILAKPTASKPSMANQPPKFITPTSSSAATLTFGGNSSFVKTSNSSLKSEDILKPTGSSTPFQQFGMASAPTALSFGQPKPMTSAIPSESKENQPTNTPISFSAKVIAGNDAKSFANLGSKTSNNMAPQSFAPPTSVNQGFTPFAPHIPTAQDKETPKPFAFSSSSTASVPSSSGSTFTPAFGGFEASNSKPPGTVTTSSSEGFPTPFASLTTSSSTPFAATPFSFNTTATSTAKTPAVAATTTSTKTITSASTPLPATSTVAASKPVETKVSNAASATVTAAPASTPSSITSSGVGTPVISTKSTAAPNVTVTSSSSIPEPKQAAAVSISTNQPSSTASSDPTDSLFGSLNICKPIAKEAGDTAKAANVFSGFGAATSVGNTTGAFSFASASGAGDGAKSFLSSTATTGTTPSSGFSFGDTTSSSANIFGKPATPATGAVSTAPTATTSTSATTATAASITTAAAVPTTVSSFTFGSAPSTTAPASNLFGAQTLSSATSTSAESATTNTTSKTAPDNIFGGGGSSIFGQASSTAPAATSTTTSIFGGGAAAASSTPSVFGATAPAATAAATPGSGSIFGATAAPTSPQSAGSIFGGIPKPDQSVFGIASNVPQPAGTGIFAAAAAATKPAAGIFGGGPTTAFGAPSAASGGSLFGGGNAGAGASSPFGSTAPANTSGSIFAAAATKPVEGGNIFGSPTQQSAASGGSIFGKSTFGQATSLQPSVGIFGAAAAQSPTSGGFGSSGGSIFGGSNSANNSASGGSIFGAAPAAPAFGTSSTFGSFSQPSTAPAFGSPNAGGFGAPASSGFGSPQQSAFAKPVFGGPATFGTSPQPAFGAQPTFGGAPTFGSPKGFGSFAATSPTAATGFGANAAAAPKGNIFETMGSQDSALTFGNLAHSTQPPQQKPSFGGSSFTSYRS